MIEVSLTLVKEVVVFLTHEQLLKTQHGTVVVGTVGGVELKATLLDRRVSGGGGGIEREKEEG